MDSVQHTKTSTDRQNTQESNEFLQINSKMLEQAKQNYDHLINQCIQLFIFVQQRCMHQKEMNVENQYLADINQNTRNTIHQQPQLVIDGLKFLINKIFDVTSEIIQKLTERDSVLQDNYDDVQCKLEKDIRNSIRMEEKLRIKIECLQMNMDKLATQSKQSEQKVQELTQQNALQKKQFEQKIKQQEQEIVSLKKVQEAVKTQNRKNQSFTQLNSYLSKEITQKNSQPSLQLQSPTQYIQNFMVDDQRQNMIFTPQTIDENQFSILKKSINKIYDDQNSSHSKMFKDVQLIKKQKQVDNMKYNYELNRLKIQVNDRSEENGKLKGQNNELYSQLKRLKDKLSEEEKIQWMQEANGDKNPNLINYYKKKIETKDKELKQLKKSQKKFAILEKKLLVKEKAFEGERALYHDQLIQTHDKLNKFQKLYSENQQVLKQRYGIHQQGQEYN